MTEGVSYHSFVTMMGPDRTTYASVKAGQAVDAATYLAVESAGWSAGQYPGPVPTPRSAIGQSEARLLAITLMAKFEGG